MQETAENDNDLRKMSNHGAVVESKKMRMEKEGVLTPKKSACEEVCRLGGVLCCAIMRCVCCAIMRCAVLCYNEVWCSLVWCGVVWCSVV